MEDLERTWPKWLRLYQTEKLGGREGRGSPAPGPERLVRETGRDVLGGATGTKRDLFRVSLRPDRVYPMDLGVQKLLC